MRLGKVIQEGLDGEKEREICSNQIIISKNNNKERD